MKAHSLVIGTVLAFVATLTANAQDADLVMRNGTIWTVDQDNPTAEAVASLGGQLIYVGDDAGVEAHIGPASTLR